MAKRGRILVELPGHAAPVSLIENLMNGASCIGTTMSIDGSVDVINQPYMESLKPEEWHRLRTEMNDLTLVSWFGYVDGQNRFTEAEIQPATLLTINVGTEEKPCLVAYSEGDLPSYVKANSPLPPEYHFHDAMRDKVLELCELLEFDLTKTFDALAKPTFRDWVSSQYIGRGCTVIVGGYNKFHVLEKSNDKGYKGEWGWVSDAQGWTPGTVGTGTGVVLSGAAAKLAAMKAAKSGISDTVTAQTPTEHLAASAKASQVGGYKPFSGNISQAALSRATAPVDPAQLPAQPPGPDGMPDGVPSQSVNEEGEVTNGVRYMPKNLQFCKKNKENKKRARNWLLRWNDGHEPEEWVQAWEKSEAIGVKAGQTQWYHPAELLRMAQKGEKLDDNQTARLKAFTEQRVSDSSSGQAHNIAKTGPHNITRATPADMRAAEKIANDPQWSDVEKAALIDKLMTTKTMVTALCFDDTKSISPAEIQKLDRPKVSPITIFADVMKGYEGWRWGIDDTMQFMDIPAGKRFVAEVIHDLIYQNLNLLSQRPPSVVTQTVTEPAATELTGAAAKLASVAAKLKKPFAA